MERGGGLRLIKHFDFECWQPVAGVFSTALENFKGFAGDTDVLFIKVRGSHIVMSFSWFEIRE